MPRKGISPGVPKRSAPCPPGLKSPKQSHERSRPKTPDFESSHPVKRNKHRTVTMARSVFIGDHHSNLSTVEQPIVPKPRKRLHTSATVCITIATLLCLLIFYLDVASKASSTIEHAN